MRALVLATVFLGASFALASSTPDRPSGVPASSTATVVVPLPSSSAPSAATLTEVVQRYCVVCHNDQLLTGNVSFTGFDVERAGERAETAERMIRKLRAGMMPPRGMPRPGGDTLAVLVETLESVVDRAATAAPNLGERRFQRLTRAEYERVVHDLLGLEIDAGEWLPPEVLVGSFDNAAAGQGLSTTLLGSYLRAASEISRMAVGNPDALASTVKHRNRPEASQHAWDHVEGTPFGTRGGMVVVHDFPADGEYVFQVGIKFGSGNQTSMEDVDLSIDGEPVALIPLEHNAGSVLPARETAPVFVKAGQHRISVAFVNLIDGPYEDRLKPPEWSAAGVASGEYGITGLAHLEELLITGPFEVRGVSESESRRRVFTCRPASVGEERACARSILSGLAARAYRRPTTDEDVRSLMSLYDEAAAEGGFEVGVRTGLELILASPEFVFRVEREPEGVAPGAAYPLSDLDLATRLSFFLWASAPDEELLAVAADGGLSRPGVVEAQVRRMLADPRSEALATRFLHQWLRLQDVGKVWPDNYLFPDFSAQLADALVRETELLFQHVVAEDLSPLDLLRADYTFLNDRVARHYGIEGVTGDHFRRVAYPTDQRQGILGHGSVLHLTSMADRTSPVQRGKWVMEVLMGTPPPPPPPNVPVFDASPAASGSRRLTTRERMEQHRRAPVCNSCHSFIDPIGLALDNFDATGRWRIRENMQSLDTRGTFYDGTEISTPRELTAVLLERPVPLLRNFTERLLSYAIGRPTEHIDQPTVREIVRATERDGYRMSSLILGVVNSAPFRMKQAQATAN